MFHRIKSFNVVLLFVLMLAIFVERAHAFGFPSGGGGCGSGCGGCGGGYAGGCGAITYCSPTPLSPCVACTCGKRKKRSILEQQLKTHENNVCPQTAWRKTIIQNIGDDIVSTQHAIQGGMFHDFENGKFFVNCIITTNIKSNTSIVIDGLEETVPIKFVSNGNAYCSAGNSKVWCTVAALLG